MPDDQAGAADELVGTNIGPETVEERRLNQTFAQLRHAAGLPDTNQGVIAPATAPLEDDEAAKALEADTLSLWVNQRREATLDGAKAWEADRLQEWVAEARTAESPAEPAPRKAARRQSRTAKTSAASKQRRKTKTGAPTERRPRKPRRPAAAAPAGNGSLLEPPSLVIEATIAKPQVEAQAMAPRAVPGRLELALRSLRLALTWHWAKLVERIAPADRCRWLGQAAVRAGLLGGLAFARLVRVAASAVMLLGIKGARALMRSFLAAVRAPLRFVSDLDVPGLIALVLAISGVVAAVALLIRV